MIDNYGPVVVCFLCTFYRDPLQCQLLHKSHINNLGQDRSYESLDFTRESNSKLINIILLSFRSAKFMVKTTYD